MLHAKVADTSDRWKSYFYTLKIYPTFDVNTTEKPVKITGGGYFLQG